MPPKIQPRQQPARRSNRRAALDPPSAPSPKATLEDTNDSITANANDEATETTELQKPSEIIPDAPPSDPPPPPRRPVQRLDSLRRRNAPPPPRPPGSDPPPLKFQPRFFIRRSKEEREADEKAEAERISRQLTTSNARGQSHRGLARGGFQGGMSGWRQERRGLGQATGPLGGGPSEERTTLKRGRGGRGGSGNGASGTARGEASSSRPAAAVPTKVKTEPAVKVETRSRTTAGGTKRASRKTKETKIKIEDSGPTYVSSGDEADKLEGPRINIEHINLISDDSSEEETPKEKGKERQKSVKPAGWNLKPIRLDRHEHVERHVGVSTAATSLTSAQLRQRARERAQLDGPLFISDNEEDAAAKPKSKKAKSKGKDVEFLRDERRWKGVYRDEDEIQESTKVKEEPQDDDAMAIDDAEAALTATDEPVADQSSSPKTAMAEKLPAQPNDKATKESPSAKKRRKPLFKSTKPVLQTEEDRQEWERYEDDVTALGEELGFTDPTSAPISAPRDGDDDVQMEDEGDEEEKDRRQGLVYLFQLPPLIPLLIDAEKVPPADDSAAPPPNSPITKKGAGSTKASASKTTGHVIKIEDDGPQHGSEKIPNALLAEDIDDFVGSVGKLAIYESGHIGISWGGIEYELSKGAEGELLQELIISDVKRVKREGEEGDGRVERTAEAMGQITGGFVVTPNWGSLFEG